MTWSGGSTRGSLTSRHGAPERNLKRDLPRHKGGGAGAPAPPRLAPPSPTPPRPTLPHPALLAPRNDFSSFISRLKAHKLLEPICLTLLIELPWLVTLSFEPYASADHQDKLNRALKSEINREWWQTREIITNAASTATNAPAAQPNQ